MPIEAIASKIGIQIRPCRIKVLMLNCHLIIEVPIFWKYLPNLLFFVAIVDIFKFIIKTLT